MNLLVLVALVLGIVAAVWAVMNRSWPLLTVSAAVVALALAGEVAVNLD